MSIHFRIGFSVAIVLILMGCSPLLSKRSPKHSSFSKRSEVYDPQCPFSFYDLELCAELRPLETPRVGRSIPYQLVFWSRIEGNPWGPYIDPGLQPHIWLWMNMPTGGHGSSPVRIESSLNENGEVEEGVFKVKNIVFTMQGAWEIYLQLKDQDGNIIDEALLHTHI